MAILCKRIFFLRQLFKLFIVDTKNVLKVMILYSKNDVNKPTKHQFHCDTSSLYKKGSSDLYVQLIDTVFHTIYIVNGI